MAEKPTWREAEGSDLAAMMRIADVVHPDFPEDPLVFSERLALFPRGVLLLADDEPAGYVLSHPWMLDRPPALDTALGNLPPAADTYYIHDIALLPRVRGQGHARAAIDSLMALASDASLSTASLISVIGPTYWQAFGFRDASSRIAAEKLRSYSDMARYMVRDLVVD